MTSSRFSVLRKSRHQGADEYRRDFRKLPREERAGRIDDEPVDWHACALATFLL